MLCFSLWFWLWCAFYNRSLKKHIILWSKCTSRLANKRIHIKLVSSATWNIPLRSILISRAVSGISCMIMMFTFDLLIVSTACQKYIYTAEMKHFLILKDVLSILMPLRGYCTPGQFLGCFCIFLKNYNTLVTSKICFL